MAPVIRELSKSRSLKPITVSTSQHRQMVTQIFDSFGIEADHELRVMRKSQTLSDLSSRLATKLGNFLETTKVAAVLVQGDTSSAFFGGLCAYYHQLPVGHVEAGLRTGNRYAPFPEEMNRTLLAAIATWHFAPTKEASTRLLREGVRTSSIYLTGNTVVDALRWMAPRCSDAPLKRILGRHHLDYPLILVTCHRRESLGEPMRDVADGLAELARRNPLAAVEILQQVDDGDLPFDRTMKISTAEDQADKGTIGQRIPTNLESCRRMLLRNRDEWGQIREMKHKQQDQAPRRDVQVGPERFEQILHGRPGIPAFA